MSNSTSSSDNNEAIAVPEDWQGCELLRQYLKQITPFLDLLDGMTSTCDLPPEFKAVLLAATACIEEISTRIDR